VQPKQALEAAIGYHLTEPLDYWFSLIPRERDRLLLRYKFGFQDDIQHTDEEIALLIGYEETYVIERMLVCLGVIRAHAYEVRRPVVRSDNHFEQPDSVESARIIDYDPWETIQRPKVPDKPFRSIPVTPWD
jgi:hypothetical protein